MFLGNVVLIDGIDPASGGAGQDKAVDGAGGHKRCALAARRRAIGVGEECVDERVAVGVRARAQALLELGKLGGGSVRIADVGSLNDSEIVERVLGGDVAEVGDGGDAIRVDPRVSGLLPESLVEFHVVSEVAAHVGADAGDERGNVGCGVRVT